MSSSSEDISSDDISFVDYVESLRIPYEEIKLATNNFTDANLLPIQSSSSSSFHKRIYKGQLKQSGRQLIDIVARKFPEEQDNIVFNEVLTSYLITHKNILPVFKISGPDDSIIINKYEANESLDKHLSDSSNLTWMRRLHICVRVAHALSYIHDYDAQGDFSVIHGNIKSSKILLDENWEPKLNCFGFSMFVKKHQPHLTSKYSGTLQYTDPAYVNTDPESDVYSFGVVLFEVLFGRIASVKDEEDNWYFARLARSNYEEKTLDDMIVPDLLKQMNLQSLEIFSETAYYCLEEESSRRPNMAQIVEKLEASLELQQNGGSDILQEKNLEHLKIGLDVINEATKNFDDAYCIGSGGFGKVYKADLEDFGSSNSLSIEGVNKCDLPRKRSTVAIKHIHNRGGEQGFISEIETLTSYKHENIISLLGFCYEGNDSMILVYEHASKGSLENYLGSRDKMANLSWLQRLKICLDIAHGLNYIHNNTDYGKQKIIHRDIKSANILLSDNWKAKIADFGLSKFHPADQEASTLNINTIAGTNMYLDPEYEKFGRLNKKSDIYSFGVLLFEMLTGRLAYDRIFTNVDGNGVAPIARHHYEKGTLMEIVDPKIKEETDEHVFSLSKGPGKESLDIFSEIAFRCVAETQAQRPTIEVVIYELKKALDSQDNLKMSLEDIKLAKKGFSQDNIIGHHRRESRPTTHEVVIQLKKSLEFQEDYEKWEPKLPKDYKEIIQMSKCPEDYSTMKKEDLFNIFSKGILLQQDKVLMSFDGDGKRNEMVSATMFSYNNSCRHEWKSLPESRFGKVVELLDISNLNIEIKIDAQFLSRDVVYGAFLVFRLCDSRIVSSKPMCVNLKYRKGHKSLHAYFATWRDKDWMMIELYRFLNQNEDVVFEFLLESFSSHYCGESAVYVEGIEFRAIEEVKSEEFRELKEVQQVLKSNFNVDQVQQLPTNFEEIFKIRRNYDELFWLGEVDEKKLLVLSAKAALYKFSDVDLFTSKPSSQSRFQEVIELLPQQVFYINCTIRSQMLSADTEYTCYLVFKLSEECQGLHNPVKVRDLLHQVNEKAEFFYFITPSPLNINDITRVPNQREDGWMEIQVWKFNSIHNLKDDSLSIDMKFTSYEGTMSGLIICGLEFRPL